MSAFATTVLACGGEPEPPPPPGGPIEAVKQFYAALYIDRDVERACALLLPVAQERLTVQRPAPPCEQAVRQIADGLDERTRAAVARGLATRSAFGISERRPRYARVVTASSDSSFAGLGVKRSGSTWQIAYLDPGAVDGGQPSADRAAIRELWRWQVDDSP
jgi:hypothetical protein